jgi:alkylated DNA repair dioxygenase AlkB
MSDLFSGENELQPLRMVEAEIYYAPRISLSDTPENLACTLIEEVPWRAEQVLIWGRKYPQPRLIAWYGDVGQSYAYSGIVLEPLPWTDLLQRIRDTVQRVTDAEFNSVLLNYYRDHRDSMGFHSDDEPELGPRPVIASLSLGELRTFVLKHKTRPSVKPVRLKLESGSLLLMKGDTQKNWKHGIEKEARPCGPRVNLTFRRIRRDLGHAG